MNGRDRILAALRREPVDRTPVCNPTSIATIDLMDMTGAPFPDACREPEPAARLAAAGYTELGFDSVMPVFSIVQESSALGCEIRWGGKGEWPAVTATPPLWQDPIDIRIPASLLTRSDTKCVLEAIALLRAELGNEVAVIGKALGPWTLAYHCFGLENFLLMTVDDPDKTRRCLDRLKEVTVRFALAQIDAGADVMTIPDHATGDMVSSGCYRRFLRDLHREFAERIPVPIILHICGRTLDRMDSIAETGVAGFHFDSRNDAAQAMAVIRGRVALVGNVNNPETLLRKGPAEVRQAVYTALEAGVPLIAPECAVPLDTPVRNLQEITKAVRDWHCRWPLQP